MGKNSTPSQEATFAFIYKDQVFIADLDEIWHDFSAFRTKEVRENEWIVDRPCPKCDHVENKTFIFKMAKPFCSFWK